MDTIMSYLETMFARLPKTPEVERIKQELQMNMEEKYQELIADGKTENEAVGTVISEFGNIDELMDELGYQETQPDQKQMFTDQEIELFLSENKQHGKMVAFGVATILVGVSIFMFMTGMVELLAPDNRLFSVAGLVPLLVLIAIAVGIFIVTGHQIEPYRERLKDYQLTPSQLQRIEQEAFDFRPEKVRAIVVGVMLCIIAPLVLIIISVFNSSYGTFGVSALLVLIALAVYLFVYYGVQDSAYQKLLQQEDYNDKKEETEDKVIGAVAAVVWPLTVALFLITGLIFELWHINWILFPITGLLFGAFAGVRGILNDK